MLFILKSVLIGLDPELEIDGVLGFCPFDRYSVDSDVKILPVGKAKGTLGFTPMSWKVPNEGHPLLPLTRGEDS